MITPYFTPPPRRTVVAYTLGWEARGADASIMQAPARQLGMNGKNSIIPTQTMLIPR